MMEEIKPVVTQKNELECQDESNKSTFQKLRSVKTLGHEKMIEFSIGFSRNCSKFPVETLWIKSKQSSEIHLNPT